MKKSTKLNKNSIINTIPLLSNLPQKELDRIKNNTIIMQYKKEEIIDCEFRNCLCIVCNGRIEVFQNENSNRKIVLSSLKEGDLIGETALFTNLPFINKYTARKDTTVAAVKSGLFFSLIKKYPDLAQRFINKVIQKLYKNYLYIEVLSLYKAKEKIPAALVLLNETSKQGDNIYVENFRPNREIGNIVSNSREVVSRVMNHYYQNGSIIKEKNRLIINNRRIKSHLLSEVSQSFA